MSVHARLAAACATLGDDAVAFAQRLIQTRSYAGDESAAAAIALEEMKRLSFDAVFLDKAGNAVGVIQGAGSRKKAILLNAHLDTVQVDEREPWPHPAFEGVIRDGFLYGRGACDTKGPLAGQIYGAAALKHAGFMPEADVYVACVVQEEVGGLGTRAFLHEQGADKFGACVIGEPSSGMLALGHRGRVEVEVIFRGKAAHAAQPLLGRNALYPMAEFLRSIPKMKMTKEKPLGASSVSPTQLTTAPSSVNVIPSEARLTLDWRNVPTDMPDAIIEKTKAVATARLSEGFSCEVRVPERHLRSYRGLEEASPCVRLAFMTEKAHPFVKVALRALKKSVGAHVKPSFWRFATDGGDTHAAGIFTVGYGEGDESLAHTCHERAAVSDIARGVAGNAALAAALARVC